MIPFSLMACRLFGREEIEVSIQDVSVEGCTFRVPSGDISAAESACAAEFTFYHGRKAGFERHRIAPVQIFLEEETRFYGVMRLRAEDAVYADHIRRLMKEYGDYVRDMQSGDPFRAAERMTGYPDEEAYPEGWLRQRRSMLAACKPDELWKQVLAQGPAVYAALHDASELARFLAQDEEEFRREYYRGTGLEGHPLTEHPFAGIQIGTALCMELLPEADAICRAVQKQDKAVTLVLPPVRQGDFAGMTALTERLRREAPGISFEVNDWGMLAALRGHGDVRLGVLMNKRRRDSRAPYIPGSFAQENALNASFYCDSLQEEYCISGTAAEACGYALAQPALPVTLYAPFYRINTAGYCTLYASMHNGDRGCQTEEHGCPGYCREHVFLYPEAMRTVGRYNALFGFDDRILCDGAYLRSYLQGVDRFVVDLM